MSITRDTVSCAFPNAPAVEISELTVGYVPGVPVLEKLSFRTSAPLVHLCGGNGSGKSTVVEVLGGTLQPWGGIPHDLWRTTFLSSGPREAPDQSRRTGTHPGIHSEDARRVVVRRAGVR